MPLQDDSSTIGEPLATSLAGSQWCVVSPVCFTEACFSVPAVRALKHFSPNAGIAVLCPKSQVSLWKHGVDEITHVIPYEVGASAKKIAALVELYDKQFDSAIIWEAGSAAKATKLAGIGQSVGYANDNLMPLLTDTLAIDTHAGPIKHRVRHYLGLVDQLGVDAFVRSSFERPPLPAAPERIAIAIAPFSEYGSSYQWPVERFLKVVEVIEDCYPQVTWTLYDHGMGASKKGMAVFESFLERENSRQVNGYEWNAFTALAQSTALVACDGEVAHMAAHVGLPAVVIFGPNAPEWKRPIGKQSLVVREHVACSPCFKSKCPIDLRCQDGVSIEAVVDGLKAAIEKRLSPG